MKKAPIRETAWNFSECPHPAQTEACFIFEYSRESEAIMAEVAEAKRRLAWQEDHMAEMRAWVRVNPAPLPPFDSTDWCRRAKALFPHMAVSTNLAGDAHFLASCSQFPAVPFLDIPTEQRVGIARFLKPDRAKWGSDPATLANREMLIMPLKNYLAIPRLFAPVPPAAFESGQQTFSLYWARSDKRLLEDFKQWLKENRPSDQPPAELTRASASKRTSPKDYLKCLSAFRLIRAFSGNVGKAREHSYGVLDKALYLDDSAWLKAARKAESEIQDFEARILRRKSVE